MRTEQRDRLGEFVTAVTPAELWIGNIAAAAIRKAEIVLAGVGQPVELVLR